MHDSFMRQAIALALESVRTGSGPFGAIVVQNGQIVGQGANRVTTSNDPTAHAEIVAIRAACQALGTFRMQGCDIYSSCEPCPMCLAALYWARIDRVYYACSRTDAAAVGFRDSFLYEEFTRPIIERGLPLIQILAEHGIAAFDAWRELPDKIEY
jgi:guanine deaminase